MISDKPQLLMRLSYEQTNERGKIVEIYNWSSRYDAMDCKCLKIALLARYDFSERSYLVNFPEEKPENYESPSQFNSLYV